MNFLPARLEGATIKLPFGDTPLPDGLRGRINLDGKARDVIAGARPEHFEDSDVEPDRTPLRFTAPISVVESMGSELYAYFDVEHAHIESSDLTELAADAGTEDLPQHGSGGTQQVVARLSAASSARPNGNVNVMLDPTHLQLFDPSGGKSLTVAVF